MMGKQRTGGWAVTLKSARLRGLHPEQLMFNVFGGLAREFYPDITAAWLCTLRWQDPSVSGESGTSSS